MWVSDKKKNVCSSRDLSSSPAKLDGDSAVAAPARAVRFRNSRRESWGRLTGISFTDQLKQESRERGRHVGRQQAADHRAETELGHFAAAFGSERTDATDLDGDAGEVGEAAERIRRDRETARREIQLSRVRREVEVADEFVEHDAFAKDLADVLAVLPRHAHEPGEGGVDPAEEVLQRHRIFHAEMRLRPADDVICPVSYTH